MWAEFIAKNAIGLTLGVCAATVMEQVFDAVLPEAATVGGKVVQAAGRFAVRMAVGYGVQKNVNSIVDTFSDSAEVLTKINEIKADCVVD
jgi:hypothetical protein